MVRSIRSQATQADSTHSFISDNNFTSSIRPTSSIRSISSSSSFSSHSCTSTNSVQPEPEDVITTTEDTDAVSTGSFDNVPPIYTIDLSLPPELRYVQAARDFKTVLQEISTLFDDLLELANLPKKLFHLIARMILRKLYSREQTAELRGVNKVVGTPMYLLVAYNVLLDTFMGCTSGGILVKEKGETSPKMMHFRTLDWTMHELRKAIAQFEFVERPGGEVIARTINYVGFVGVVTGVRQGLSLSLNARPYHNNDNSIRANLKFYAHLGLVLLGLRPCIATHLRDFILPRTKPIPAKKRKDHEKGKSPAVTIGPRPTHRLSDISRDFPPIPTTAAYLVVCDDNCAIVLEKDRVTANPLSSSNFIVVTNHDKCYEAMDSNGQNAHMQHAKMKRDASRMEYISENSKDRKVCITKMWEKRCKKMMRRGKGGERGDEEGVGLEKLKSWLLDHPINNDLTHLICIMDPGQGVFRWVRCFEEEVYESDSDLTEVEEIEEELTRNRSEETDYARSGYC